MKPNRLKGKKIEKIDFSKAPISLIGTGCPRCHITNGHRYDCDYLYRAWYENEVCRALNSIIDFLNSYEKGT